MNAAAAPLRPSFFEVYAAEHLSSALRPALRFTLEVLSVRHPRLVRIAAWSDEIFTALLVILETSQLRKDSSTLAESFYSLRRSSSPNFSNSLSSTAPLTFRQVVFSVLLVVVAPHAKLTLDQWYTNATGGAAADMLRNSIQLPERFMAPSPNQFETPTNRRPRSTNPASFNAADFSQKIRRKLSQLRSFLKSPAFRRLILRWYPRFSATSDGLNLLFNILYLYGHTRHFTPALALQGLVLRRLSTSELLSNSVRISSQSMKQDGDMTVLSFMSSTSDKLMGVLKVAFFAGIFAFRFLEYYYAAEAAIPKETGPSIRAPVPMEAAAGIDRKTATAAGLCPLCHQDRVNPTACVTSGFVFCYLCILKHVQEDPHCPVTLAPATVDDLVRVFDDAASA